MTERRAFLGKLAASGLAMAGSARLQSAPPHVADAMRNVRSYGAKGDGKTDDTAAFNAATVAAAPAPDGAGIGIFVPPGTYRIDGTVFVRKGQTLVGAGDATVIDASRAKGRTVVLGRDLLDREDPGGAPVTLAALRFFGGSESAPLIQASLAGFAIRDLFITSPGIALEIGGGDGIVSNIIIDQALNGIILRGARNILIDNLITYVVNYAVTIDRMTNDVALSNMIIAYSSHASILFSEGATGITSIRVAGATFVSNVVSPSFVGHVHARAEAFDAQFSDCVFRNWRGFAVSQAAGSGADLIFADCTFDGARSHASYNASATASGIRTGVGGRVRLSDCRFLNLSGPVAAIGPDLRELTIDGGMMSDCRGDPIDFVNGATGRFRIRNMDGFGRRIDRDGSSSIVLPWWGASTAWRVSAMRRGSPGGVVTAVVGAFEKDGTMVSAVGEAAYLGEPVALSCAFGSAPGGPRRIAVGKGSGALCVTAPMGGLDWTVETVA